MNADSLWSLHYLMGRWHPTIGDPDFMGWFTVASYCTCALAAAMACRVHRKADRRSLFFWSLICLLMILLGINKQLDLQSLFTEVGRQVARAQGWYGRRRTVQFWFIVAFGTVALAAFLSVTVIMRDLCRRFMLALTGLFFLITFVVTRAASFHHFDEMLGLRLYGAKMNWVLELTGIFTVTAAALQEVVRYKKRRAGRPCSRPG